MNNNEEILESLWDCEQCGKKAIGGLKDSCPNCGNPKSSNVRYYFDINNTKALTEEDLNDAGLTKEECDGNHTDWICPYCKHLNNHYDTNCSQCGSAKDKETKYYKTTNLNYSTTTSHNININDINKDFYPEKHTKKKPSIVYGLLTIFIPFLIILGLLCPFNSTLTVKEFNWEYLITIEENTLFYGDDWYLPDNATLIRTAREIRRYNKVLDHYETKTRQVAKQVEDGYTYQYTYRDNGNGTVSKIEHKVPKYKTIYETETYEEPVYRQEPVYDTKYYYSYCK